jgi:heavy metal sensor kinase
MTLTTRLSVFFLAALALVLAGFSTSLYVLARGYLYGQVEERLDTALNTLVAVVEITPEGVEWEPHERQLSLAHTGGDDLVSWTVRDDDGTPLPTSPVLVDDDLMATATAALGLGDAGRETVAHAGQDWRVSQRRVEKKATAEVGAPPRSEPDTVLYPALVLTVATSLEPVQAKLRGLGTVLAGLSAGAWLAAAALGRWTCRRALAPVSRMAVAARSISAANLDQRLPNSQTEDELGELGIAFNGLLDRLQDSFERQRRFTGDASHQLRTPLAAMLGQAEVALRHDRTTSEYRAALERVQAQALELRQIVEMLLFLARADAESSPPPREPLSVRAWVEDYLARWSSHPRAADLKLDLHANDCLDVEANQPLLSQLVDNLLENACKYSCPGTAVTLRVRREGRDVVLSVEDSGPGISTEDLQHVFEPFYRSAASRRQGIGGVGLGLAVALRIAIVHGGSLDVESLVGQGSRFSLRLPAKPGVRTHVAPAGGVLVADAREA